MFGFSPENNLSKSIFLFSAYSLIVIFLFFFIAVLTVNLLKSVN